MATVRDLLKGSLRLLGAVSSGETPSNDEMQDGLSALNQMLDGWATENLTIYAQPREEFSLVAGTGSYTIGSSGTFNTTRPLGIIAATIEDQSASPTVEYPIEIINSKQWADISVKDQTSPYPNRLFMDVGYPLNTIYLWPKPSTTHKLVLYTWKPQTAFASLETTLSLAPGYERALKYNLATEWAPEFGRQPAPEIVQIAMESKENIKRLNIKPQYMEVESVLISGNSFNIYTGE